MNRHVLSKTFVAFTFSYLFMISAKDAAACTGMDVIITKITFTSITSNTYTYTYEIKNTGTTSVPVSQLSLQNYVATDAQATNEKAAGGSVIDQSSTVQIAAGATYTGTMSAYPNAVGTYPQSSYPYLIVSVSINPGTECNTANNILAVKIELTTTGTQSQHIADATLIWNTAAKSFSVSNWSGSNGNALEYTVITASGTFVASGKAIEEETVSLHALQNGMYIIYLTDGEKVYSKKIIY